MNTFRGIPSRWLRPSLVALAFGAATFAFADSGLRYDGSTSSSPAIYNSFSSFPQINETFSRRPIVPPNPKTELRRGAANNLRVNGGVTNQLRATVLSKFPAIGATGYYPPDPHMAAGPTALVAVVNTSVAFFTKGGTKQFQQDMGPGGFFSGVAQSFFVFDPKVVYDPIARRWVVIVLEADFSRQTSACLVAISDDETPSGTWYQYRIDTKFTIDENVYWLDYPGIGFNKDAVVLTGNLFDFNRGNAGASAIVVLPKAPMLQGQPVTASRLTDAGAFTVSVGTSYDQNSDKVYMTTVNDSANLKLYALTNVTQQPPTITTMMLQIPTLFNRYVYAESRGGARLDTIPWRVHQVVVRDARMVAAHTTAVDSTGQRAMVRWYEVDMKNWPTTGTPVLLQSGNVTPPGNQNYFMPGIGVNRHGDIAMIMTRSSQNIAADIVIASRKRTDAPGTVGTVTQVATSPGTYPPGAQRWGDYHAVAVDPTDDATFWGICSLIVPGSNWSTDISRWEVTTTGGGSIKINPFNARVLPGQGNLNSGTLASLYELDGATYDVSSQLLARVGQTSAVEITFQDAALLGNITYLALDISSIVNQVGGVTGMVWFYNYIAGRYEHARSFRVTETGDTVVSVPVRGNVSQYIDSGGRVRAVVRGLVPIRRGASRSFLMYFDQIQLGYN